MVVVHATGMLEGRLVMLNGMLHLCTAANGVCNLLQAAFNPPPESTTLQEQLKDVGKSINSGTEVKSW